MCCGKPQKLSRLVQALLVVLCLVLAAGGPRAWAGSARFISGQGWGTPPGNLVLWNTSTLLYFTDLGPLSPTVNHAQAEAMVAAAAAVWTVPTSSISLAQGGNLAEDVSTANVLFDGTQYVFPADVRSTNEDQIPVAIAYDVDGTLVDALLGEGASEPDGCGQNAVVGDIDDIHQSDGTLRHATLILNGRCVGSAPEQLTQMQYQLARAFGRVLGLSWSQTNDNVFTGQTEVTAHQVQNWPLMHPIDVVCGEYTYQCMSDPFTLRTDDLNTLAQIYPVYQGAVPPGKQGTSDDALYLWGILYFPTGQGMAWVNLTTRRLNNGVMEDWESSSAVTGNLYTQAMATPVNDTAAVNSGAQLSGIDGYFVFRRVPLNGVSNVFFTTEPINPLYVGDFTVGAYVRPPPTPSGSPVSFADYSAISAGDRSVNGFVTASDAAANCSPGEDGTEASPAAFDPSGWQAGLLCAGGHNSWFHLSVSAGHDWTLEVTATDESGAATVNKAQPVMGVWSAQDATGTLPTVASQPVAFNSLALGMTRMLMGGPPEDQNYRLSISDQYGAGRPDFSYTARTLYAATVAPTTLGSGGGRIVVTGSGFRQGNQLLVNGVPAHVLSWTATSMVADAPTMQGAGASLGVPLTITVADPDTGGWATIPDALSYAAQPNLLQLVSAPAALETGVASAVPFSVRVLASDGLSPVPGASVSLVASSGSAAFAVCGGASACAVQSDADGLVQTVVTGGAPGSVTLTATELSGGAIVQVMLNDADPVRAVQLAKSDQWVAAGVPLTWTLQLTALQDGAPAARIPVNWSVPTGLSAGSLETLTEANGTAEAVLSAAAVDAGSTKIVEACAWSTVCASWHVYGVDSSQWRVAVPANWVQTAGQGGTLAPVTLQITDLAGHPLQGAPVQVYQRVLAWEGSCAGQTRCASAPVLTTSKGTLSSTADGEITVVPLEVSGVPQVVEIAATTGLFGFVTLTLVKAP